MENFTACNQNRAAEVITKVGILMISTITFANSAFAVDDCGNSQAKSSNSRSFMIFDGMGYLKKPDLSMYGIKSIAIIDRGIWPANSGRDSAPDPALVKGVLEKIENSKTPVVLDFESYPLTGSDAVVSSSLSKLMAVIAAFRAAAPDRTYGFYATLPLRDYWRAIQGHGAPKYKEWQAENDKLRALEQKVNALFPSIYTFYDEKAGWIKYATEQICEARRLSMKPVYVFLWPYYHPSNPKLGGTPIDPEYWRIQLDTAQKFADGVVIWGGWDYVQKRPANWDENAKWWKITIDFMQSNGLAASR
jgi:hypothetical protein